MFFSVEQAFVGRDEKRAPLKTTAWEARFSGNWSEQYAAILFCYSKNRLMVTMCVLQRALTSDGGRLITRDHGNCVFNRVAAPKRVQHSSLAMSEEP